jgi:hypothetical protein
VAIKGGDLIHVGNKVLIDRAQTAGPGQVTIDREKIYELGNYYSLASILDTPDLSFSLESYDVSAEFEALLCNRPFSKTNGSQTLTVTGNPSGGTFTVTFGGQTTTALAYNASPADVQTALEALTNLAPGDVYVSGTAATSYIITVSSAFLAANTVAPITVDATALTSGSGTPAITVATSDGVQMLDGTALKPTAALPMDVASAFKPGVQATNAYNVVGSVAIPYLQLESLQYQFGVSDTAQQTASLKGDSLYYIQSTCFIEEFAGTNTAGQAVTVAHPAVVYKGDTVHGDRYALSVSLASSGTRLLPGDYSEAVTGGTLTVTINAAVPTTDQIRVIYASTDTQLYPQASHAPVSPVRPAAIKGRNVECYVGGINLANRWTSVQQVSVQWQVTLEKDEELGNPNAVSQTYDVPAVTGSIDLKPRNYAELYNKICQIAGVTTGQVAGPLTTVPLELLIVLYSPDEPGLVLKSIEVPDARFTLPGYSGQAGNNQKLTVTFSYESDSGDMTVYKGRKPGF